MNFVSKTPCMIKSIEINLIYRITVFIYKIFLGVNYLSYLIGGGVAETEYHNAAQKCYWLYKQNYI